MCLAQNSSLKIERFCYSLAKRPYDRGMGNLQAFCNRSQGQPLRAQRGQPGEDPRRRDGRPSRIPFALAWATPDFTRSRMSSRSNSAMAANTVKANFPMGVVVSIDSCTETNCTPSA